MNVPPFFVLRLPRYSITHLVQAIQQPDGDDHERRLLDSLLAATSLLDAIKLASPSLYQAYRAATTQQVPLPPAVSLALWRYIVRSHTRATPFGLFSGVGLGRVAPQTALRLDDTGWVSHTQLDAATVGTLRQQLNQSPPETSRLRYQLNSSVYVVGDEYRYSERMLATGKEGINLTALARADFLESLVGYFMHSPELTYGEIRTLFPLYADEEVVELVNELVAMQFLMTERTLSIIGPPPLDQLIDCLDVASAKELRQPLVALRERLRGGPLPMADYSPVNKEISSWLAQPDEPSTEVDSATYLQTNLYFEASTLTLATGVAEGIRRQLTALWPLLQRPLPGLFTQFMDRFVQRFDQQQIPLLQAMDPDVGVGYVGEAAFRPFQQDEFPLSGKPGYQPDQWEAVRMQVYRRHLLAPGREVELTKALLRESTATGVSPTLPVSTYAFGELYQGTGEATGEEISGWRFYARSTLGPAATLLGRFCAGNADLREAVLRMHGWEQQQYPSDVLAEVGHWPMFPPRSANVVARPSLRDAQISYLDWDLQEVSLSLRLADLLITVRGTGSNRHVILTDGRTGRRVRPRLSTAFNAQRGDEIYQFLFALQLQDCPTFAWSWGQLSELPFLPRLRYQQVILSRARWTIHTGELPRPLRELTIDQIREIYGLPRYVLLIENDNELWLDLEFGPAQLMLRQELDKRVSVRLDEWLTDTYAPFFSNGDQVYTGEIVLPILHPVGQSVAPPESQVPKPVPTRCFPPGSEWLYIKLYCSSGSADELLTQLVGPLLAQAYEANWIDRAFFIRYSDPSFHLRLRFHCQPSGGSALLERLNELATDYLASGLLERLQLDTYERELERYSPELIEGCEAYFCADSQLMLTWLVSEPQPGDLARYRFALASSDQLLEDVGLTLSEKLTLSLLLQEAYWNEQGSNKEVKKYLNSLYRDQSTAVFESDGAVNSWLADRTRDTKHVLEQLRTYLHQKGIDATHSRVVHSLLHMTLNRIFVDQPRLHELVVYHFLARYYESLTAQHKRQR